MNATDDQVTRDLDQSHIEEVGFIEACHLYPNLDMSQHVAWVCDDGGRPRLTVVGNDRVCLIPPVDYVLERKGRSWGEVSQSSQQLGGLPAEHAAANHRDRTTPRRGDGGNGRLTFEAITWTAHTRIVTASPACVKRKGESIWSTESPCAIQRH